MVKLKFRDMNNYVLVVNQKEEELGIIEFDKQWKKTVWVQEPNIRMSGSCLNQVLLNMELFRKKQLEARK